MLYAVYDVEIKNAIPPTSQLSRIPEIQYCEGWTDFENMGLACWSMHLLNGKDFSITGPLWGEDITSLSSALYELSVAGEFQFGGFNSIDFDDHVIQAQGLLKDSDFDILKIVVSAAGFAGIKYWKQGYSYKLSRIAEANGFEGKTSGANAPVLWQQGSRDEVIKHCQGDTLIAAQTLKGLFTGDLIDPNFSDKRLSMAQYLASLQDNG